MYRNLMRGEPYGVRFINEAMHGERNCVPLYYYKSSYIRIGMGSQD
jgi:hypothetical protein